MRKLSNRGFTLIELLVVITIIAILSTAGAAVYTNSQKNARDAKRRGDIDAISKALETHYNASVNQYCTANAGTYCAPQDTWFASGGIPKNPTDNANYSTLPTDGAATYQVCATLEMGGTYCKSQQQ